MGWNIATLIIKKASLIPEVIVSGRNGGRSPVIPYNNYSAIFIFACRSLFHFPPLLYDPRLPMGAVIPRRSIFSLSSLYSLFPSSLSFFIPRVSLPSTRTGLIPGKYLTFGDEKKSFISFIYFVCYPEISSFSGEVWTCWLGKSYLDSDL